MPPAGAERWFHTLVVVGAALGGCGGRATGTGEPAATDLGGATSSGHSGASGGGFGGGAGVSGAAPRSPDACAFDGAFVCDDYATGTGCRCDATRPRDASACANQFDFVCTALTCTPPPNSTCFPVRYVGCECDPAAPKPEDCESPEQFFCTTTAPPWHGCGCRTGPAAEPSQCRNQYCCQSNDPRFGCGCFCARIG